METSINYKFLNYYLTFQSIAYYGKLKHDFHYNGNIFCPFHYNQHTPSARLYKNPDGEALFCFTEHKLYRPTDLITTGIVDLDLAKIQANLEKQVPIPDNIPSAVTLMELPNVDKFKAGEISYIDFIIGVCQSIS